MLNGHFFDPFGWNLRLSKSGDTFLKQGAKQGFQHLRCLVDGASLENPTCGLCPLYQKIHSSNIYANRAPAKSAFKK